MNRLFQIIRTWKLPVAMFTGIILYFLFEAILPEGEFEKDFYGFISHQMQPTLIFCMLFLSFLKVDPRDMKPHRWHGVLLLTQGGCFVLCSLAALCCRLYFGTTDTDSQLLCEGAMLCFICPTATASAVIVQKLGGSLSGDVTYLILCNLMVSILAPGFLTLVEPSSSIDFMTSFFMIMGKVFPLLLFPLFVALIIRHYAPKVMEKMLAIKDLAFYMWLIALAFAITVTVRTIIQSHIAISILFILAFISLVCCIFQFRMGRKIGYRWTQPTKDPKEWKRAVYDPNTYMAACERSSITAGQAFGQKNTVFIIWMGLVFLNPVTSVVGGFYSIWHNIINAWQLYKTHPNPPQPTPTLLKGGRRL